KFWIHETSPVDASRLAAAVVADGVREAREVRRCSLDKQIGAEQDLVQTQIEAVVILRRGIERSVPLEFRLVRTGHCSYQSRCGSERGGVGRRLQFRLDHV